MDSLMKDKIINIFPNTDDLFQAVVENFVQRANAAVVAKGVFTVVLSGGNTANFFFDALTASESHKQQIPWDKIKIFFGDERYVPSDNEESNYGMAKQHLFSKTPIPTANIYPMPTDFSDPKAAAENYEITLRKVFKLKNHEFPRFDLIYLGLGENAHTASLMPFSDVVKTDPKNNQLVASLWVPELNMFRITLTPNAINNSACICFLVTGKSKASAVWNTLEGSFNPQKYPAQLIQGADEKTIWYLDKAAAEKLGT